MENYQAPGKLIKVNNLNYNLYCTGKCSPTVILEAGLGESFLSWYPIQQLISEYTQVCSYDRAGLR